MIRAVFSFLIDIDGGDINFFRDSHKKPKSLVKTQQYLEAL